MLVVAGCLGGQTPTPSGTPAPVLSVGDHWILQGAARTANNTTTITTAGRVAALEAFSIIGQTYDAVRMEGTAQTQSATLSTRGSYRTWVRAADQADLQQDLTVQYQAAGRNVTSSSQFTYDAPCPNLAWPLYVGKSWSVSCTVHDRTDSTGGSSSIGNLTRHSDYRVAALENLTVPAGTYLAYRIEINATVDSGGRGQTTLTTSWYAPKMCTIIQNIDRVGSRLTTMALVSGVCATGA